MTQVSAAPGSAEPTLPTKPAAPTASAGNASATVTWTAATVKSLAGTTSCIWTIGPLTCTVKKLTNRVSFLGLRPAHHRAESPGEALAAAGSAQ
jgi:hypothetical protein